MVTNDALWKGIIEDLLEDFLAFFFPEVEFEKEVILITGKKISWESKKFYWNKRKIRE